MTTPTPKEPTMPETPTTEAPPIHWSAVEPGENEAGEQIPRSDTQMATHFAAMAAAHMAGYSSAMRHAREDGYTRENTRTAIDRHLHPGLAAFAAAAALLGWDAARIGNAFDDAPLVDEWSWQWLTEAGLSVELIQRLTHDLNVPGVVEALPEVTA